MKNLFKIIVLIFICTEKIDAQIPFTFDQYGHIIIRAKLNGIEGSFFFDTGAGLNAIFTEFSKKIENIESNDTLLSGQRATGEKLNIKLYNAKSIEIGDNKFQTQQYTILDLKFRNIDGIISLQPFKNMPITIDYVNKEILFNQNTNNQQSINIETSEDKKTIDIFTYVVLNNKLKTKIELDSGAGENSFWFGSQYLDSLGLNRADFDTVSVTSDFGKKNKYYKGKLKNLSTENRVCKRNDINVSFIDGLIHGGKTSIDWIGKVFTIDIPQGKIFIERP